MEHLGNSGSANWFQIDGDIFGVTTDGENQILDDSGAPYPLEWEWQNTDLVYSLINASNAA